MQIRNTVSSKDLNTFGINVTIDTLIEVNSAEDLHFLKDKLSSPHRILGGGSNVLIVTPPSLPVFHINIKGIHQIKENTDHVLVKFSAGEVWHDVVLWAIENDLGGIENLSLIPGRCGAAPMQNIGAYGVELKDVLHSLTAFNVEDGLEYTFHHEECGFDYRTSYFKTKWKDRFIITDIILKLTKPSYHKVNISYGAISSVLEEKGIPSPTIKDISDTVIAIRKSKLPDPKNVGNAGSFFKNPIIPMSQFKELEKTFKDVPSYPVDNDNIKLPAGWLIDQCGWKGKVVGETGTYKNQALVLVNHGDANGSEVLDLSKKIQDSVMEKYGVSLEREVNVW